MNRNNRRKWTYLFTSMLFTTMLAMPSVAAAQDETDDEQGESGSAPEPSGPANNGEVIMVTAERRTADVQDVAASVTVRDGELLLEQGKFSLEQILEGVPGVGVTSTRGSAGAGTDTPGGAVVIRGIPSNNALGGTVISSVPAAASYVDGVYGGVGGDHDLERVEILRGPQGTLYGRSATSGVIATHSRNPQLGEFGGNVSGEIGTYDLVRVSGAVNIPIGDMVALRVSGLHFSRDGYYAREGAAVSEQALRAKLLIEPSDTVSLLLGFALQEDTSHTGERNGYIASLATANDVLYQNIPVIGENETKFRQYWAEFNLDLGGVQLTYIPALRTWNQDALAYNATSSPPSALAIFQQSITTPRDRFHTQELRFSSDAWDQLTWQAGVFYYHNDIRARNVNTDFPATGSALDFNSDRDTHKTTEDLGVFGEATLHLSDSFRVTGGARYDWTDLSVDETYIRQPSPPPFPPGAPIPARQTKSISVTEEYRNFSYRVRLEADLSPDSLVYASVSTGFLPGDVSIAQATQAGQTLLVQQNLDTETLTSYEIGTKNRFLDGRLLLNGSAFYYDYGGYQLGGVNIGTVQIPQLVTLNSPAEVLGGELELAYRPSNNDRFGFAVQYTDAQFVDQPAAFLAQVGLARFPNVSKWAAQASYGRRFELPGDHALTFNIDGRYQSGQLLNTMTPASVAGGFLPYLQTGDQFIGNANVVFDFSDTASVTLYVRNVTDNRFKNAAQYIGSPPPPAPPGDVRIARQYDPRTFGAVLNVGF